MTQLFNGVAKDKFEKWALKNVKTHLVKKMKLKPNTMDWVFDDDFYKLPLSMQIGVVEDFAESLGYDIRIVKNNKGSYNSWISLNEFTIEDALPTQNTKKQAREELIKELNNLINNTTD